MVPERPRGAAENLFIALKYLIISPFHGVVTDYKNTLFSEMQLLMNAVNNRD